MSNSNIQPEIEPSIEPKKKLELGANLYCIEPKELPLIDKTSTEYKEVSSLYFTTEFWKALAYKEGAYTNFACIAPLVGITPLLISTDIYYNRTAFVLFSMYYAVAILFIKNLIYWWICLRSLKRKYRKTMLKEIFTPTHLVMNAASFAAMVAGLAIIAYYVALGDRHISNLLLHDKSSRLETPEMELIPWLTKTVHSYVGVAFVYLTILGTSVFIFMTDKIDKVSNSVVRKHQYKWKICIVITGTLCIFVERQASLFIHNQKSFIDACLSTGFIAFTLCFFYGFVVFLKETKQGTIVFPKRLRHIQNRIEETSEIVLNILCTALILGVGWFTLLQIANDQWFE
ncbi:hypothetical protein NEHOM01_1303 [Nematocida homosporus]|uniref:uncharacterized protein n=1 Tax=Nematocida homosporus TaxID=1912981 RepID=UPI00221FF889|nr:uncharacterized protein NEHOM01_1303 [Nematocida homosporus]KAI5186138.1 hypothetical protein NEHOM01_1303 [Nematocida homosporus]